MKNKFNLNSLFFKISAAVATGIIILALILSFIITNIAKDIFTDVYSKSQEKIFNQIYEDLYGFHSSLINVMSLVESNWTFKSFLNDTELASKESYKTIYYMKKNLEEAISANLNNTTVMLLGLNGQSYINNSEKLSCSVEEIINSPLSQKAIRNNGLITYNYISKGFTYANNEEPALVVTKAIKDEETKEIFCILYISIKESDFQKFYEYFTSEVNDIFIIDGEGKIISSNDKEKIGTIDNALREKVNGIIDNELELKIYKDFANSETILVKDLPYCNLKISGIINNSKALNKMFDVKKIILVTLGITTLVLFIIFLIIKQLTKPLSDLSEKMASVRNGDFNNYIEVNGTEETKQLSETYNYMLEGINNYIEELVKIQKEKRSAEIHALQMQINPHYIFNTLTSIKYLLWQGNEEKCTKVIDAFILLLRNTISNKKEFITVNEEIENVKNYVYINNIRYGGNIDVQYFIMEECQENLVPKLILQPFIENAFFHGFPGGQRGSIDVFVRKHDNNLKLEIIDDGIGFSENIKNKIKHEKTEHFTGIGIKNVDDRIKLIYGHEYGVTILSKQGEGTRIIIDMPGNTKEEA